MKVKVFEQNSPIVYELTGQESWIKPITADYQFETPLRGQLSITPDVQDRAVVKGHISATPMLPCARCDDKLVPFSFKDEFNYVICRPKSYSEKEVNLTQGDFDFYETDEDGVLDLSQIVTDVFVSKVPEFSSKIDKSGKCLICNEMWSETGPLYQSSSAKINPFDKLKGFQLKK